MYRAAPSGAGWHVVETRERAQQFVHLDELRNAGLRKPQPLLALEIEGTRKALVQAMQLAADDAPHIVLGFGVGRNGGRGPWLPLHGQGSQGIASSSVFRVHGPGMVVTEVYGDVALPRAGHRCVQLGFLEHRCLRGVRTSHSAPSFDDCRTRVVTGSRWTGLVLKSGLHAADNSRMPGVETERSGSGGCS